MGPFWTDHVVGHNMTTQRIKFLDVASVEFPYCFDDADGRFGAFWDGSCGRGHKMTTQMIQFLDFCLSNFRIVLMMQLDVWGPFWTNHVAGHKKTTQTIHV